ncbi:hypothetical protein QQP08_010451 [Theobroma cacao]|nr:hypothetical protein QQP08_010451 [Theobroma cacao]
MSHIGSMWRRPVILPLLRAGGLRCSVKPASRSTHHFRNHETQSLHSGPTAHLLAWSGQARIIPTVDPTHSIEPVFHHHNAPT